MNTINATEARAITDSVNTPLEVVFSQIKAQSERGDAFTYAIINNDSKDILSRLGYTIENTSQPNESRISW